MFNTHHFCYSVSLKNPQHTNDTERIISIKTPPPKYKLKWQILKRLTSFPILLSVTESQPIRTHSMFNIHLCGARVWTNEIPQWAELHSRKPQEWNPSEDAWTEIWNLLSTSIENLLQMLHKQQSVICFIHTSNILIRWLSSFGLYKVKCNPQYVCLYEQHKSLLKTSSNWITGPDTHAHKNMFAWPSDLWLNKFSLISQIFLPLSWFLRFRYLQR